jgi:cytochrome c oxidase assembly factor CtaG
MSPTLDAALRSWPSDPWLLATLLLTACIYLRGWRVLRRRAISAPKRQARPIQGLALGLGEERNRARWNPGQVWAFLGGLGMLYLALASPIESFADLLLQCHMAQHLLLLMAVPPLLWLGAPAFPLLRGLPEPIRSVWLAPLFRSPALGRFLARATHPLVAVLVLTATTWIWHIPAAYELVLRSPAWHYLQHGCFLAAGLLFWYPVVRPYPSRPRWSLWLLIPCLLLADVQNTALSALLTFADHVIYPHYAQVPRLAGSTALADQAAAGVLMWVPGSLIYLVPMFAIAVQLLGEGQGVRGEGRGTREEGRGARGEGREKRDGRIPLLLISGPSPLAPRPFLICFRFLSSVGSCGGGTHGLRCNCRS